MPRKKRETTKPDADLGDPEAPVSSLAARSAPRPDDAGPGNSEQPEGTGEAARHWARSFKATLSLPAKGVTLGERNGHDWVISFPGDPGKETKDRLRQLGFEYRDYKWKLYTHAPTRAAVEALVRDLKRQHGDEIAVNDYPTRQVVLAFDAPPDEEIIKQLKEASFHFRSDFTWNGEFTPENQKFARDLMQSLPDKSRSASAGRG